MASEDSEWAPEVAAFEAALGAVEGKLAPLLAANAETIKAQLSPLEHAKLELTLAYSMNSLYWSESPRGNLLTSPRSGRAGAPARQRVVA